MKYPSVIFSRKVILITWMKRFGQTSTEKEYSLVMAQVGQQVSLYFPGKILSASRDTSGHWAICVFEINDTFVIPGNIFGYNKSMFVIKTVKFLCHRYPSEDLIFRGE